MQPIAWRFLVVSSLLAGSALAATRPHYGGTLRVRMRAAINTLDPAQAQSDPARERLLELIADRLVRLDDDGRPQPALAASWQHDSENRFWQFRLRPGVQFHDGTPLTGALAVSALQAAGFNPDLELRASGQMVTVKSDRAVPDLPVLMAAPRLLILHQAADGTSTGTGPFRIARWEPGRHATLTANDAHWAGRPYLDVIDIEMGRAPRDQLVDLELDRADIVEVSPPDVRRASQRNRHIWSSAPVELLALRVSGVPVQPRLRDAVSLAIDRQAIVNVLLQRQGEAAGGLLPQSLSGYAFLFSTAADVEHARQLVNELSATARVLTAGFDGSDANARAIMDRIAVNLREAGIRVQPPAGGGRPAYSLDLLRLRVMYPDPTAALASLAAALGLTLAPAETAYSAEKRLLEEGRIIPLVHLPEIYGMTARVRGWSPPRWGGWRLQDVWLESDKPQ